MDIVSVSSQFSATEAKDSLATPVLLMDLSPSLKIPLKFKNGDVLLLGYNGNFISLVPEDQPGLSIYAAGFLLGYSRKWNEQWTTQLIALPRIAAKKGNRTADDCQLGGLVVTTKKVSDRFRFRFGAYYNSEFFSHFVVPVAGFDWRPDSTWQVYGNLPLNTTVLYKPKPRLHFGFNFTGIITSYYMDAEKHYLQRSTNDLSLFADIWLSRNIVLQPKIGYALGRSYREYAENDKLDFAVSILKFGNDRVQLNEDIRDSPFAQLSLIFRVKAD